MPHFVKNSKFSFILKGIYYIRIVLNLRHMLLLKIYGVFQTLVEEMAMYRSGTLRMSTWIPIR